MHSPGLAYNKDDGPASMLCEHFKWKESSSFNAFLSTIKVEIFLVVKATERLILRQDIRRAFDVEKLGCVSMAELLLCPVHSL